MPTESLEALIARYLAAGDERAIAELVRRTRPRLLAVARRIGKPGDAEDSVQTAYMSLLHRAREMEAPILPWLITAVVRIAYGAKAARQKHARLAERLSRIPQAAPESAVAQAVRAEEGAAMRRRVDRLSAPYRDAVVLHYFHGLSTDETALLLGVSRDAVKKRLQRGRALLRSRWNPRVAGMFLAGPWFVADTATAAAAAAVGAGVLKSKLVIAGVLVLLSVGTAWLWWDSGETDARQVRATELRAGRAEDVVGQMQARSEAEPASASLRRSEKGWFGVVVDAEGEPVGGAAVEIRAYYRNNGAVHYVFFRESTGRVAERRVQADARGRFRLDPKYTDEITALELHTLAPGYGRTIVLAEPDEETRILLQPGATLRTVTRDEAGAPIPGADWTLIEAKPTGNPGVLIQKSDESGVAVVHLAPGTWRVRMSAAGYAPSADREVELKSGETKELDFVLTPGIVVQVHVLNEADEPVPNAKVELQGPRESGGSAQTDREGRCRIGGISVPVAGADFWSTVLFYRVTAQGHARLQAYRPLPRSPGEDALNIRLVRGVPVTVRVVRPGGEPAEGITVQARYNNEIGGWFRPSIATTDADGRVHLPHMRPGNLNVQAYVGGTARIFRSVELSVGKEPVRLEIEIPGEGGRIRGIVLESDGKPVRGGKASFVAEVSKDAGRGAAELGEVDSDGKFVLQNTATGPGRLWVSVPGYAAQSRPLNVRAGDQEVTVTLRELDVLGGKVVTRAGAPLQGIKVTLKQKKAQGGYGEIGDVTSTTGGAFLFRGVAAGEYRVRASSEGYIESVGLGVIASAGTRDLTITLKPRSEGWGIPLVLDARNADGTPFKGPYRFSYYKRDGERGRWHFRIEQRTPGARVMRYYDEPGACDFAFTAEGHLPCIVKGVRVEDKPDHDPIVIRFKRGKVLRVRALDPSGAPYADTSLTCDKGAARTNAHGEAEFGGFTKGVRHLRISVTGDPYTSALLEDVEIPGEVDIVLKTYGKVFFKSTFKWGDVQKYVTWQLFDAAGNVLDERKRPAGSLAAERHLWTTLKTAVPGPVRAVMVLDGQRIEKSLRVRLHETVTVEME